MKKILVTSPSLDAKENVSGISTLILDIISNSKSDLTHFLIGSKDGEKKNVLWMMKLLINYLHFIGLLLFRNYNVIHINSSMEPPAIFRDLIFSLVSKILFRKKTLLHLHGGYYLMNQPNCKLTHALIGSLFKSADAIIVLSALEKETLSRIYGEHDYLVFPNAVDTKLLQEKNNKLGINGKIQFIFLGNINNAKGIFTISESMQYLTGYFENFALNIYGDGPDLEKWLESLSQYPNLNYKYHGVIKGREKWDMLSAADVFLLPSFHEGLPMAMLEAMAAGCLVIVSDDATMTTVVSHNENGIVIPKRNPKHLANKIKEIIDGEIDRRKLGYNARLCINENHSFSTYIKNLDELYSVI